MGSFVWTLRPKGQPTKDVGCMTVGEDSMNLLSHGQVVAVKISMSFPFFVQTDFVWSCQRYMGMVWNGDKKWNPITMISSFAQTDSDLQRRFSPLRPQVDAEHRIFQRPKNVNLENQN